MALISGAYYKDYLRKDLQSPYLSRKEGIQKMAEFSEFVIHLQLMIDTLIRTLGFLFERGKKSTIAMVTASPALSNPIVLRKGIEGLKQPRIKVIDGYGTRRFN